ncbi:MAG: hypothetical protein OXU79_05905 [Gemmatimonadota bacterium]|nr:hypothetical protein [Gemmatimonadota bacterium]
MPRGPDGYSEDDRILARLIDPVDAEAFSNLMEHAHKRGMSAADFIREVPERTSRKAIRRLCLKDRKQTLRARFSSIARNLWGRPAEDPETEYIQSLYSTRDRPQMPGRNGQNPNDDSG